MDRALDRNVMIRISAITVGVAILSVTIASILLSPPRINGSRDVLHAARIVHLNGAKAPESIDFDPSGGGPYVGVADGRILKWENDSFGWTEFAVTSPNRKDCLIAKGPELEHVCGRPLGLHFEKKTGDLYICDCYLGLLVVGPKGGLATPVVTEVEGRPLHWTNHLDIDEEEDAIYFTDSSKYYQIRTLFKILLTKDLTGRLIRYDKSTKEAKAILEGLHFPNGVALSKDRTFLIVSESGTSIIYRVWLKGPNAGKHDIFTDKLPGSTDNIRRNSKGEFWAAMHAKNGFLTKFGIHPLVGKFLLNTFSYKNLEHYLLQGGKPHALAVKLSENGEIVEILEDSEGKTVRVLSEVMEHDGKLWFGSITEPFIGIYDLNK